MFGVVACRRHFPRCQKGRRLQCRRGDKARVIVPRRYDQPHRPVCSFVLIDLEQAFAKRVYGYADNGVGVGIKVRPPAKRLGRYAVLLNLLGPAREALLTDVFQEAREVSRAAKDTGRKQPIEFPSFGLGARFCGRNVFGSSNSSHGRRFYTR